MCKPTTRQQWFLYDGATSHIFADGWTFLDTSFFELWIGRGGLQTWPYRSPDPNHTIYMWGHVQTTIF